MELREFIKGVWIGDGPPVRTFGFEFPSRMIVVKLADGSVWINSPVEANTAQMQSIAEIGPVSYLIAPTPLHAWRLDAWAKAFPGAQLWGPPGSQHVLTDVAPAAWAADLDQMLFKGSRLLDEVYFLHRESHTLIFGDFIQQYSVRPGHPFFNAFTQLAGLRHGGVAPDIRLSFIGNKAQGRQSLQRLLAWDFDKVILAHGMCVDHDAKAFVRKAFSWLGA